MKLIFLGAPGAGKGTQAKRVEQALGTPQVSTGDMLRAAVRNETKMGLEANAFMQRGDLVPDDVVVGIVKERLTEQDVAKGFILDGFPRTVAQADALGAAGVVIDHVINFDVPQGELVGRLTGRRSCPSCGAMFHVMWNAPKKEGTCDECAGALIQRADDNKETVTSRLQVYEEKTQPLIDYYRERGLLKDVDGTGALDEIRARVLAAVKA